MAEAPKNEPQFQRKTFDWVVAKDAQEAKDDVRGEMKKKSSQITAEEIAQAYGVPDELIIEHLNSEIKEEASCRTLPFTLVFLLSYAAMVVVHDPLIHVNAVEDSIVYDISNNANFGYTAEYLGHKTIEEVNSPHDFWSWLIHGYFRTVFTNNYQAELSEGLNGDDPIIAAKIENFPVPEKGLYLNYNRIIGGVRFRQERNDAGQCDSAQALMRYYRKPCAGGFSYETMPQMPGAHITDFPTREFWIWAKDEISFDHEILKMKELEGWLDKDTQKIEIALPVYNPDNGVYSLVTANFFFSSGGRIWKRMIPLSTYAKWYGGPVTYVPDAIWAYCLLSMLFTEFIAVYQAAKHGHLRQHFDVWVIADLCTVGFAVCLVMVFVFRVWNSTQLNKDLAALLPLDNADQQDDFRGGVEDFVNFLESEVHTLYYFRLGAGLYPLLMLMKLFKAFSAQARLAIVTDTLSSASTDLVHFLLVFLSIFLTYAVAGVVLFGREIDNFSTFARSVVSSFRIMMGDFDWEELSSVGRTEAGIWFCTFIVIIVLLMLNMLLAIVMDAYATTAEKAGDAETLWAEAGQMITRFLGHRRGTLVKMAKIVSSLNSEGKRQGDGKEHKFDIVKEMAPEGTDGMGRRKSGGGKKGKKSIEIEELKEFRLVTVLKLMEIVNTDGKGNQMRDEQALELIKETINQYNNDNQEDADVDEILSAVRKVNRSTKTLKNAMKKSMTQWSQGAAPAVSFQGDINGDLATGPTFKQELRQCMTQLEKTRGWITTAERQRKDHSMIADLAYDNEFPPPLNVAEDSSAPEVAGSEWGVKQVIEDKTQLIQACRKAGLSTESDDLRMEAAGQPVRVLQYDATDGTVKCRVPDCIDLWFGLGALRDAGPDQREEGGMMLQAKKRAIELQTELKQGRQTVTEALAAVSELQWRLSKGQEEKQKIQTKTTQLKKKVVALKRENVRLIDDTQRQDERLGVVGSSREDYEELVAKMDRENQKLKSELANIKLNGARDKSPTRRMEGNPRLAITSGEIGVDPQRREQSGERRQARQPSRERPPPRDNAGPYNGRDRHRI